MAVEFKPVAEAALALASTLLPQWMGGKRQGHEWVGARKANGGIGDSWSVNLETGHWGAFSSGDKGGDLISLYAALNHIDQVAALKDVAAQVGMGGNSVRTMPLRPVKAPEEPPEPIPPDAPPLPTHPKRVAPAAVYAYGTAFRVARYDLPDGTKTFSQWTWRKGEWYGRAHPGPRPLYGVELLKQFPHAPVLIVEGEKCAHAAREVMLRYVCLTWAGGSQAVKKTDWTSLEGREEVIIWPDADEPGARAAAWIAGEIQGRVKHVRVIKPEADRPAGWDIADAIAEGWDAHKITLWAAEHVRTVEAPQAAPTAKPTPGQPVAIPVASQPAVSEPTAESAVVNWHSLGLDLSEGGTPHATLANTSLIIQAHPRTRGNIWYDLFTGKIMHTLYGPAPIEWCDGDDVDLTAWIQQTLRLPKINLAIVQAAVGHAARRNARNSLTDWLSSLKWDGVERLETWISDCLGCELTDYTMAVSRNFPLSMVARAFVPGCQVDSMPVLEGRQGRGKSSFLSIFGAPWYVALPVAFGDKDFLQAIQGNWLIEIPDMTGFSRREHTQILATITIRTDVYRPSYGRRTVSHPRSAVFAATSETDDYLQDARGRRRYWPVRCGAIDLDTLRAQRDQIFAEAVLKYREGATWYEMPEAADDEQLARATQDLWTDRVLDYCDNLWEESKRNPNVRITSSRILADAIELAVSKQDDGSKKRLARIMREAGWIQLRDKERRHWKKVERPS